MIGSIGYPKTREQEFLTSSKTRPDPKRETYPILKKTTITPTMYFKTRIITRNPKYKTKPEMMVFEKPDPISEKVYSIIL